MRISSSDDINNHIENLHKCYERLDALITPEIPLRADDIYATALFISLPPEWTNCISRLLQSESTTSSTIVRALKQESTRRKSKMIKTVDDTSASRVSSSKEGKVRKDKPTCTFCNRDGHELNDCQTAGRILKDAKDDYANKKREERENKRRPKSKRKPVKAGKTEHAILRSDSGSDADS